MGAIICPEILFVKRFGLLESYQERICDLHEANIQDFETIKKSFGIRKTDSAHNEVMTGIFTKYIFGNWHFYPSKMLFDRSNKHSAVHLA